MDKRNNLAIKTKYKDLETAKSCVDKIGRSKLFINGLGKFYGEFEENKFTITSSGKTLGVFEFSGEFVEEHEIIWMKGSIKKREDILKRYKLLVLFMYAFSLILLLSMNPVFMVMAILFLFIPIINKRIIDKSDTFYETIVKRVVE